MAQQKTRHIDWVDEKMLGREQSLYDSCTQLHSLQMQRWRTAGERLAPSGTASAQCTQVVQLKMHKCRQKVGNTL